MRDLRIDEIGNVYGGNGRGSCRPKRPSNPCGSRGRGSRGKGTRGKGCPTRGKGSRSKGRSKGRC